MQTLSLLAHLDALLDKMAAARHTESLMPSPNAGIIHGIGQAMHITRQYAEDLRTVATARERLGDALLAAQEPRRIDRQPAHEARCAGCGTRLIYSQTGGYCPADCRGGR